METSHKIWFWVSFAFFIIPEILWSPVINIITSFFQNSNHVKIPHPNFLVTSDYIYLLILVIFIQLLALVGNMVLSIKQKKPLAYKIILGIVILMTTFVLLLTFSSRKGIGF